MDVHRTPWCRGVRMASLLAAIVVAGALIPSAAMAQGSTPATKPAVHATGATAPGAAIRVDGWTGIATYPGVRPIVVNIKGRGLSRLTAGRIVGPRGAPARGIEVIIGPGTDLERQVALVVKAEAMAGKYTLVGLGPDGVGTPLPFSGAMDLTVLDPKLGQSPIGAMMGMIGASRPPGMPTGGIASGAGAPDRSSLAGAAGLPTGDIRGTQDFSSHKPGDSQLMEGGDSKPAAPGPKDPPPTAPQPTTPAPPDPNKPTTPAPPDPNKPADPPAVTSESSASDVVKSDGSAKIDSKVKTTSSDGTWMLDVMTYTRTKDGQETETQTVTSGNAHGETGASHSCTGKCTPMPDQGGCAGDKACEKAAKQFAAMFPLVGAMQQRFIESRFGSLGGNSTEPGGSGTRKPPAKADGKAVLQQRASPYINPNPEGGSSSGSPSVVKVSPNAKPQTNQPKPVDPPKDAGTKPPILGPTPKVPSK